jgi:hypothetical protein
MRAREGSQLIAPAQRILLGPRRQTCVRDNCAKKWSLFRGSILSNIGLHQVDCFYLLPAVLPFGVCAAWFVPACRSYLLPPKKTVVSVLLPSASVRLP